MSQKAILIGNSDGIGLAMTTALLKRGWEITGFSKSGSPIHDPSYRHVIADVRDADFPVKLKSVLNNEGPADVCVYCAGIGELLDVSDMADEANIFDVNLTGMVKTAACLIPAMVEKGGGHFIGISSVADALLSPEAPSYHASKAGFSNYLEGLALALRPKGVHVSNVRFGFVDTKMAKGDARPFMMGVDQAVTHLLACIDKKPMRYTAPKIAIPVVEMLAWILRLRVFFSN